MLTWTIRRFLKYIAINLPDGKIGSYWRRKYYEKLQNVIFEGNTYSFRRNFDIKFSEYASVILGDSLVVNNNVTIDVFRSDGIYIGNNVSIGPGVYIRSSNHVFGDRSVPIQKQGHRVKKTIKMKDYDVNIVVGNDVLISANCIILSGAVIGDGCVVAAGAVVTGKEYPPYSIIGGNPARVIGKR